jgi:hypothetical protein
MGFPAVWADATLGTTAKGSATTIIAAAANIALFVREIALFGTRRISGTFRSVSAGGLAQCRQAFQPRRSFKRMVTPLCDAQPKSRHQRANHLKLK